jgi:hypothetical protein
MPTKVGIHAFSPRQQRHEWRAFAYHDAKMAMPTGQHQWRLVLQYGKPGSGLV